MISIFSATAVMHNMENSTGKVLAAHFAPTHDMTGVCSHDIIVHQQADDEDDRSEEVPLQRGPLPGLCTRMNFKEVQMYRLRNKDKRVSEL